MRSFRVISVFLVFLVIAFVCASVNDSNASEIANRSAEFSGTGWSEEVNEIIDGEVLIEENKTIRNDSNGSSLGIDTENSADDAIRLDLDSEVETELDFEEEKEAKIALPKKTIGEVGKSNFVDVVTLQGLDKITAKVRDFDVKVGDVIEYEKLVIEVMKCWKSPPTQTPENKVLMKIWEKKSVTNKRKKSLFSKNKQEKGYELEEIFFGWMFSSSPGLSGLEHSVYDITVIDCKDSSIQE